MAKSMIPQQVKLYGIHPISDFLPNPKLSGRSGLHIVHTSAPYEPAIVVFWDGVGSAYSVKAKEANKSNDLLADLDDKDRVTVAHLAELDLPKPDYSMFNWSAL